MFEFCRIYVKIPSFHSEVIEFVFSPFMAHDVLERSGEFGHYRIPNEFVGLTSSLSDVFADDFDLVVDPVSDFWSANEGEE
jgi:hypothetical protein